MAGKPDENKKSRCNHPDHEGERYLPVEKFYTAGYRKGVRQYGTFCRECDKRKARQEYAEGKTRNGSPQKIQYQRARSRALTKLSKLVPELYEKCLIDELRKESTSWGPHTSD